MKKRDSVIRGILFMTVFIFTAVFAFSYSPPSTVRTKYNFNYDWKFIKQDVAGAQTPAFNDTSWTNVSLPHCYNDYDFYDTWSTGGGHNGWTGKTWYRKHFKLPSSISGKKVIIEFEDVRQAAEVYINGTWVGRHENGTTAFGFDLTPYLNFGATENVLSVKVDNTYMYPELSTGTNYVWNTPPFDPNMGGIINNVNLHVSEKLYHTLPLYGISLNDTVTNGNLGTYGTYVYARNIDTLNKQADITAQAEVKNETGTSQTVTLEADIVDQSGSCVLVLNGSTATIANGQIQTLSATGNMTGIHLWAPDYPYLYKVYTILKVGGTAVDTYETPMGVRKISFNVSQGLKINGRPFYLKGFAPRSTMEWVAVGQAPTWLEEYDFTLMTNCNANFIRPMHVSPKSIDVNAADKFGIIYACPAGDAEGDNTGRMWEQRVELRKDSIIYFRNNPSVVFWEAGNQNLTPAHMQQMKDVAYQCDPYGGRLSGTRSADASLTNISEYLGSMDVPATSSILPLWDAEYCRTECPRRVWDAFTPPSFGYRNICDPANTINVYPESGFLYNSSEDLARANVDDYFRRWKLRGGQGLSSVMSGGAKIIFADSISHGRMVNTEVARVTGVLDGARLPKEAYFGMKACQSDAPSIHIIGHWNYPAGTVKNVIVISSCDQVSLATYNADGSLSRDYGFGFRTNNFEFSFSNVQFVPGKVKAIGYSGGLNVISMEKSTAGLPSAIKVTPITGPNGFFADGSDIAMFDIEVVDSSGNRCPTNESKVTFTYSGAGAVYLGGYNSGIQNSTRQNYLNTECGINRVFVRSTRTAGSFTLTASGTGLTSGSATITSTAWAVTDGLTTVKPQSYSGPMGTEPPAVFDQTNVVVSSSSAMSSSSASSLSQVNNLAYQKPVTFSGQQAGTEASNAVDGNSATRWASTPWPQWIQVDLGAQSQFDSVELIPYADRAYQYYIEASTDGTSYNRIVDQTGNTVGGSLLKSTFTPVTARYVKLTTTGCANYTGGFASYFEFRVLKPSTNSGSDTTPDQFNFADVSGADVFGQFVSAPITVSGINSPAVIQITAYNEVAYYSINGGAFVQTPGTVNNGDQVRVQLASGSQYSSTYYARLDIGGVWDDFNVVTKAAPGSSTSSAVASSSSSISSSASGGTQAAIVAAVALTTLGGNTAAMTFDGNAGTRWESVQLVDPQWIYWDLGSSQALSQIVIDWEAASASNYTIEGSTDAVNWTVLATVMNPQSMVNHLMITNTLSGSYRYVKMNGTSRTTPYGYSIWEVYIYTAGSSSSSSTTSTSSSSTSSSTISSISSSAVSSSSSSSSLILLSQGKTATASTYQTGNLPANANDGSSTTRWTAGDGTFPQWWSVDLGASVSLSRVDISWYMSTTRSYKYKIEVSADGNSYQTVADKTTNTAIGNTSDIFSAAGRYVRVTVTGASGGWASFYEVKVY